MLALIATLGGLTLKPSASSRTPVGQIGSWRLTFDDDFSGTRLDTSRWIPSFPWGPLSDSTPTIAYRPDNVRVYDGLLHLQAVHEPYLGRPASSGMVSTGDLDGRPPKFAFTHGYVEARMSLPAGLSMWPAFWLLPASGNWPPEIDVIEHIGSHPDQLAMHYHYVDAAGRHRDNGESWSSASVGSGFHTFGVEWSPGSIRWFVDGQQRRGAFTDAAHIVAEPMYLLLTLQVATRDQVWAPRPEVSGAPSRPPSLAALGFPAELQVDYVRVWQRR